MDIVTSLENTIKNSKNGDVIYLSGGTIYKAFPVLSSKIGITIEGAEGGAVIGSEGESTGFAGSFGKNNTIKNVTFCGSNAVHRADVGGGTVTFENCTFAGASTYGFHIDQSNGATLIFTNCTFIGFNAFAGDLVKSVFNNCTFLHNGNYGHTNIWSVGEFNNCRWGDKASVSSKGSGKLFFNGVEETYHHEFIGSAESLFAFAQSVNEGDDSWKNQRIFLVSDIDLKNKLWTPIGQAGATTFAGVFDGNGHTIFNLKIDSSAKTNGNYSSGIFGCIEAPLTAVIKNFTVDGATVTGNRNVAVIVGCAYATTVENCHVKNAKLVCNHVKDDACGDKAGAIVGYAENSTELVKLVDCTATDSTVSACRDAGQLIGAGYSASVNNCTTTNVIVTANGDSTENSVNNAVIGCVFG